jgi:hypothetical protein
VTVFIVEPDADRPSRAVPPGSWVVIVSDPSHPLAPGGHEIVIPGLDEESEFDCVASVLIVRPPTLRLAVPVLGACVASPP